MYRIFILYEIFLVRFNILGRLVLQYKHENQLKNTWGKCEDAKEWLHQGHKSLVMTQLLRVWATHGYHQNFRKLLNQGIYNCKSCSILRYSSESGKMLYLQCFIYALIQMILHFSPILHKWNLLRKYHNLRACNGFELEMRECWISFLLNFR